VYPTNDHPDAGLWEGGIYGVEPLAKKFADAMDELGRDVSAGEFAHCRVNLRPASV